MEPRKPFTEAAGGLPTRREFLHQAAAAAGTVGALTILPGRVFGGQRKLAPSDKLNLGAVGVGGMGGSNLSRCETENIIALCDVDSALAAKTFGKYPNARRYGNYREMFDKEKDLDAVIVATPDHTHAVVAMAAMQRGLHVYVQKPIAHAVWEARLMTETARKHKISSQMGNQGHSGEGLRLISEWVAAGALGQIKEVHAWTNRPVWPQGVEVERPKDTPPVPATMDWDEWIGPAPSRPFHPTYHPGRWRAWWDFGTGSLGDMGCHILDPVFAALDLKYPISVEGCISTYWEEFWKLVEPKNETYPRSTIVRYNFPARKNMPPLQLTWWDGGLMPARPAELEVGRKLGDDDGGVLLVGSEATLMAGCYGRSPRLIPETRMRDFTQPAKTLERVPKGEDGHEQDWIRSCKDGKPSSSNFDYSGPLSEMVLMGNLAVRFPGRLLLWDGEAMKVTNDEEANAYVRRQYREGWKL
ncbi:MAG TPA: Gfo/Idh/MocA family oxidoreductase [Vicinamibacterales bacterium]|nr:Gfo/Idh/MocA family oxidoreductase [Vicinamibacterales bacterium]HPW19347.1 Gfo/Idh/MocA family oxidoreductase [Vicinamibacterales bacterium]